MPEFLMSTKAAKVSAKSVPFWRKYLPWLIGGLAFLTFANSIGHGYNLDDELVTRKHRFTSKGLKSVGKIFTSPYYSDNMGYAYGYRPMVHLSYALEHQFFGENPRVSHFFNVLLFALTVVVFFRLLLLWTGEKGLTLAVAAAVLFAVHPVHTEVVNSLKNRDEILALLFGLAAGISATRAVREKSVLQFGLSALWFVCALLSKKSMYPLVFIFPTALVLFESISLKNLLIITIIWVIPGSWIASDTPDVKFVLLLILPLVYAMLIWWLNKTFKSVESPLSVLKEDKWIIPILCMLFSAAVLIFAKRNMSMYGYALSFVPALLLLFVKPSVGLWFLAVFTGLTGWIYQSLALSLAAVFVGYYQALFQGVPEKRDWKKWSGLVVVSVLFWLNNHLIGDFVFVAVVGAVFGVYHWKKVWGIVLSFILAGVTTLLSNDFGVMQLSFLWLGISGLLSFKFSFPVFSRMRTAVFTILGVIFMIHFNISLTEQQDKAENLQVLNQEIRVSDLQEGRKLEYGENTLTAPHSFGEKIGTGAATLGEYFRLMVFPYELSFYYGFARLQTVGLTNPRVWIFLLLHLGLTALAVLQFRKRPMFSLGIFWYLVSILLFSNWVELVAGMVGERLAFTASAGFCIALAAVFHWKKPALDFKKPQAAEVLFGVLVLLFCFRTVVRNPDWKDSLTLMGHDIEHLSESAQANNLYAMNLMASSFEKKWTPEQQLNMRKLAISHFDKALEVWPGFFNAAYDKGRASLIVGDIPNAIDGFERAVNMDNEFMDPYYQLSELYINTRQYPQFLMNARRIFAKETDRPEKYNLMARAHYLNGSADSAKTYLRWSIQRFPTDVNSFRNMAELFRAEGKADSVEFYRKSESRSQN